MPALATTRRYGIPVTTVAQTLFDLASGCARAGETETLIDLAAAAQRRRLLELGDLHAVAERGRRRHGAVAFRRFLEAIDPTVLATRSRMERKIIRLCEKNGLRRPEAAIVIEGFEVDLAWRRERVIVEYDSAAFHSDVRALRRDRQRDFVHGRAGYATFRVTWPMLRDAPQLVVSEIRRLLSR